MAGYSGTPLSQKLGIKPGARLHLINAPADFAVTLGPLPAAVEQVGGSAKNLDLAVLFVTAMADLQKHFPRWRHDWHRPGCSGSLGQEGLRRADRFERKHCPRHRTGGRLSGHESFRDR